MSLIAIKSGAVFISDAHENINRRGFWNFLNLIKSGKIRPTQLFLLGDMFDFLSYQTEFFANFFSPYIELIDELGINIEIYYFEGNHDYNLARFFKNIKIYPIQMQPVVFQTEFGDSVAIAHGDIFLPFFTKYALLFLRTNFFLKTINFIDRLLENKISKSIFAKLERKRLEYIIENFYHIAEQRVSRYNEKIIIEGHFHQGKIFNFKNKKEQIYINIATFACEQSYFIVEYAKEKIRLVRKEIRGQNV